MYMDERATPQAPGRSDLPPQETELHGCAAFGRAHFPLAMVYTPIQAFENLYDIDAALKSGTLFRDLDLPFRGKSIAKGGSV